MTNIRGLGIFILARRRRRNGEDAERNFSGNALRNAFRDERDCPVAKALAKGQGGRIVAHATIGK